ncbi:hemolysin family protein [Marinicrinis lubricantis]|uniref:Hemolysin family protein n=1 Tax=Marinicrinis lubricantis TaxID=2086470 RepID=A0ABW1IT28_9BACL
MITLNLFLVALLIIMTAFFVSTEFAIVKLRGSRIDQLVAEGRKNAKAVQQVAGNLDGYLSACQLGITITAMGLGWLGEPTVERMLHPVLEGFHLPDEVTTVISFLIAFIAMTVLHVVVGELAPKTVAIQKAEWVSLTLSRPLIWWYKIMYPFIWLLNGSANLIVKMMGLKPVKEHEEAHSEEELRIILSDSYKSGKINQSEFGYVNRIFTFDDLVAKEIMVPRTDMICLSADAPLEENMRVIREEQYTRFPVMKDNKDQIIGFINTKQFFLQYSDQPDLKLEDVIHPLLTVSEAMPIKNVLKKMQAEHTHIAILLDEFGGTSGMITIEDILEEIVGDIRDEFDEEEKKEIEKLGPGHIIVDGKVSLTHLNQMLGIQIDSDDLDTIGGWLYSNNSELKKGSTWSYANMTFKVLEKDKHRIRKIEMIVNDSEQEEENEEQLEKAEV